MRISPRLFHTLFSANRRYAKALYDILRFERKIILQFITQRKGEVRKKNEY